MRRIAMLCVLLAAVTVLAGSALAAGKAAKSSASSTESASGTTAQEGELALSGSFGLGGVVTGGGSDKYFAFDIRPELAYYVINRVGISFITGYNGNYNSDSSDGNVHVIPFLFGAKYQAPLAKRLNLINGIAIGPAISINKANGNTTSKPNFGCDLQLGIEYNVRSFLGLTLMADSLILARDSYAVSRHSAMFGVTYYLPL